MVCKFDMAENNFFIVFNFPYAYIFAYILTFHSVIIPCFLFAFNYFHISNSDLFLPSTFYGMILHPEHRADYELTKDQWYSVPCWRHQMET